MPKLAVKVADCVVLMVPTIAVKLTLVACAGTVMFAGTVIAELLLDNATTVPPAGAAELSATVQESEPDAEKELLAQVSALRTGTLFPFRLTVVMLPVVELLATSSCPDEAPATSGSNCTRRVTDAPGFSVAGNVGPENVNPDPDMVALLIVSAVVPADVSVRDCVEGVFTVTFGNERLVALIPRAAPVAGFKLTVKL